MENQIPKLRRLETVEERAERLAAAHAKAQNDALAEQDELDAMVRRSLRLHGA
jgi:hypothetical protein